MWASEAGGWLPWGSGKQALSSRVKCDTCQPGQGGACECDFTGRRPGSGSGGRREGSRGLSSPSVPPRAGRALEWTGPLAARVSPGGELLGGEDESAHGPLG